MVGRLLKGHYRKAKALVLLERWPEAAAQLEAGLAAHPGDGELGGLMATVRENSFAGGAPMTSRRSCRRGPAEGVANDAQPFVTTAASSTDDVNAIIVQSLRHTHGERSPEIRDGTTLGRWPPGAP